MWPHLEADLIRIYEGSFGHSVHLSVFSPEKLFMQRLQNSAAVNTLKH